MKKNITIKNLKTKMLMPISIVATLISIYFLINIFFRNFKKIIDYNININMVCLIIASLLLIFSVLISGVIWHYLLIYTSSKEIPLITSLIIHNWSWLLKYIPGQLGSVLGKLSILTKKGFTKRSVLISSAYENIFLIIASIIFSIPGLWLFSEKIPTSFNLIIYLSFILISLSLLIIFSRKILNSTQKSIEKLLGINQTKETTFLSPQQIILFTTLYLIPRSTNAIGFVFIVASLTVITPNMYIGLGIIFILSSLVGLLAFTTPGGLGVREAIMTLLLSGYFPIETASILAILARIVVSVNDVIILLFNYILWKCLK